MNFQDENNPFSDTYQHREHMEKLQLQEQQRIQMENHLKQHGDSPQQQPGLSLLVRK